MNYEGIAIGKEYVCSLIEGDATEVEVEEIRVDSHGAFVRCRVVASIHYSLPGMILEMSVSTFHTLVQTGLTPDQHRQ